MKVNGIYWWWKKSFPSHFLSVFNTCPLPTPYINTRILKWTFERIQFSCKDDHKLADWIRAFSRYYPANVLYVTFSEVIHVTQYAVRYLYKPFKLVNVWGGCSRGSVRVRGLSVEPPKLKEMRHYNTPALPQNSGNPFIRTLTLKLFRGRAPTNPLRGTALPVRISSSFL